VPHSSSCDALRHIDAFVCLSHGDTLPYHGPRILPKASATLSAITMPPVQFTSVLPVLDSATDCRSNPIAHRVRRKPQRLPPSLLIENASVRYPAPPQKSAPRRFRSRLATIRQLAQSIHRHAECKTCLSSRSIKVSAIPRRAGPARCPGINLRPLRSAGRRHWMLGQFAGAAASMRRVAPAGMSWTAMVAASTVPSFRMMCTCRPPGSTNDIPCV